MKQLQVENLGKQFGREWIFKNLSFDWQTPNSFAITGGNGSGKSTLLKILAGTQLPTAGKISFRIGEKLIPEENIFRHISYVAPYLQVPEELTLSEVIDFHAGFKPFIFEKKEILEKLNLGATHKPVKYFSSGMKQKLKLGLAIWAKTDFLFLDEPTSNLDSANTNWYKEQIINHLADRLVLIASNDPFEYDFCKESIHLAK